MAMSLAQIRAKLQEDSNRSTSQGGDSSIYAHWNAAEGTTSTLRFVPDADPNNSFFWIERALIKLPFAGIRGQADSKPVIVQVPCVEMWGEACPILAEVRTWFKDSNLEEMGRKYWKKRSYLFQGFVRANPLTDDKTPENPIRRFVISPQIFTLIKNALLDPEVEHLPTDYVNGLDFNIKKTSKGGYADYNTSTWARKETALTAAEQAAIETYGLFNLADFLPKKPDQAALKVMVEMFEASVDGQPFDTARWGEYFRPNGDRSESSAAQTSAAQTSVKKSPAPVAQVVNDPVAEDDTPVAEAPVIAPSGGSANSKKAEDILAMIRNRQKAQ